MLSFNISAAMKVNNTDNALNWYLVEHQNFPLFIPPYVHSAHSLYVLPPKLNGKTHFLPLAGPELVLQLLEQTLSVQIGADDELHVQVLQSFFHVDPGLQLGEENLLLELTGQLEGQRPY